MLPFELTKDTPYLALSGELWSVFYEFFNRNWSCYKGFLLYVFNPATYIIAFLQALKVIATKLKASVSCSFPNKKKDMRNSAPIMCEPHESSF